VASAEAPAQDALAELDARLAEVLPQLTAASGGAGGWVAYRAGGVDELEELFGG